jgi:DNA modification methylase
MSVNSIADKCGLNRSTVIRSMRRLREHTLLETTQDGEWWRHRESNVGPARAIMEPVFRSRGTGGLRATSSRMLRSGLHNLDCFEGLPRIEANSVQLVLTDLPTGQSANDWDVPLDLDRFWQEVKRILKPNGAVVMFAHFPFDKTLAMSNREWLKHEFVWVKEPTGFLGSAYQALRAHEIILVFAPGTPVYNPQTQTGGKPYRTSRKPSASTNYGGSQKATVTINDGTRLTTSVLEFRRDRDNPHATGKPVNLLELLLRSYSNPGDLCVDPVAGSAGVGVACLNSHRPFLAFEKNKAIFEAAKKRLDQHARMLKREEKAR